MACTHRIMRHVKRTVCLLLLMTRPFISKQVSKRFASRCPLIIVLARIACWVQGTNREVINTVEGSPEGALGSAGQPEKRGDLDHQQQEQSSEPHSILNGPQVGK